MELLLLQLLLVAGRAVASPPAGGSCGTFATGIDYTGHDLKANGVVNNVRSPTECCAACAVAPGCNAWTLWGPGAQCYLKVSAAGARPAVNHTSGNYTCLPPACHRPPPPPDFSELENETDCLMRSLFVAYAAQVNPNVKGQRAQEMVDALSGDPLMGAGCRVEVPRAASPSVAAAAPTALSEGLRVYVDAAKGSDAGAGTVAAPFQTVERAVAAIRAGKVGGTVSLRSGIFHMKQTLELTAKDSGLVIETYPGDSGQAWLSGAAPLTGITWKPVNTSGANIWSADLSGTGFTAVPAMRWAGQRLQRARFPNSNAETGGVTGWFGAQSWLPSSTVGVPPSRGYNAGTSTERNDTFGGREYSMQIGGTACNKYTPSISHFCGANGNDAGGGVIIDDKSLPNQPYQNPTGATITAMHGGSWCSFTYSVGGYDFDSATRTGNFTFSSGGQQCGRPEGSHGPALIEGVLEELDEASEFHFDPQTKLLTLWHNATSGTKPPVDGSLEIVQTVTLINASGTQAEPVRGFVLRNVGLRDTAPAVLRPHIAPTGGDWAVNRAAAVSLSGSLGATIANCTFWRLDNAGVFLGGFGRNITIADNHFAWLGESAIVSVGDTEGVPGFPGWGVDGRSGNQPRGSKILRNIASELGIVNKQSALYFQAATSGATVQGNVGYNGARR